MSTPSNDRMVQLLARFGHQGFRPGQERAIHMLLGGRDVLALLPTGAGKSLVYQLSSQLLPGVTVVVTPLIALMRDQQEALAAVDVPVEVVSGTVSRRSLETTMARLASGEAKLLYVTPERFTESGFRERLRELTVSLVVVDEAHTISEWGHSFRPAYLALTDTIAALGRPTVLALTATATAWVRDEIVARLGLREPAVVVHGVDRPNLFFEVRRVEQERDDRQVLEQMLTAPCVGYPDELCGDLTAAMEGSGIIYTATTQGARETAEWLQAWGIAADYYHGQRSRSDRERVQSGFMSGELRVIAATNAFGLGVDKPDVRFVIHRDVPGSLEAYYQEAGRAGRDGAFARCTLIYRPGDLSRAAFLASSGELTREEVQRAAPGLRAHPNATLQQLEEATRLGRADLIRLMATLSHDGIVTERRGRVRLLRPDFDPDIVSLDLEQRRRTYERSRFDMVRSYAETRGCRRRLLLSYFGEEYQDEQCGRCDGDLTREGEERVAVAADAPSAKAVPFETGDQVAHTEWGEGVVQGVEGDGVRVLFGTVGYKLLSARLVTEGGLLRRVA